MELVLVTSHFPYGRSEEFLETEIHYLKEVFDKIQILCLESDPERLKTSRPLPEGVEVHLVGKSYQPVKTTLSSLAKFNNKRAKEEMTYAEELFEGTPNNEQRKMRLIYESIRYRVTSWLEDHYPLDGDNQEVVLYSYWFNGAAYALADYKRRGFSGRAIARAHGFDAFFARGYQPYRVFIANHLDQIAYISDTARQEFISRAGHLLSKSHAELTHHPLGTFDLADKMNLKPKVEKALSVVTVSRITQLKRLDILVVALEILAKDNIPIHWRHFGTGEDEEELIERTGMFEETSIEVSLMGYVANPDIHNFYQNNQVDLFLNMSDIEGVPVSIMEAISYGIPAIARDVGGNREIVESNISGYLLDPNADGQDYAEAILRYRTLDNDEKREFRLCTRDYWDAHYNADKNYQVFVDDLVATLKGKAGEGFE